MPVTGENRAEALELVSALEPLNVSESAIELEGASMEFAFRVGSRSPADSLPAEVTVKHRILAEHAEKSSAAAQLVQEIIAFNRAATQHVSWKPVLFCLRDPTNVLCGGLSGYLWGGWLYVDVLWVREDLRAQGWGRSLLAQAEAHAFDNDCRDVYLSTFGFQAPEFYRQLGYQCAGELANYPNGWNYYFLHKHLEG